MAYSSDETGREEIYVRPFAPSDARRQISLAGGAVPGWQADDRELFFVDPNSRKMMAVDVRLEPQFEAGVPRPMFDTSQMRNGGQLYDVTADGRRFLMIQPTQDTGTRAITLVQNWATALNAR